MIDSFEDFCLWMYVIVDDLYKQVAAQLTRPGPAAECSDSELLTMTLVGECRGWDMETAMLSHWHEHRDLFPVQPSQSRFNRRRRQLRQSVNMIRQQVLARLDVAQDEQCVIDSLPVPVMGFHLVPGSSGDWAAYGADFGKCASKKITLFGYKLHVLVTLGGVIRDFVLAPASFADITVGADLLSYHYGLEVFADKGYISAEVAALLLAEQDLRLLTVPRANQKRQLPACVCRTFNAVRQIVETVNGQLVEQFHLQTNHALSFWGLCTRLLTKLTAHTLCIYINRLLGKSNFLQIKGLAFPMI
jgi:hypothetical protein